MASVSPACLAYYRAAMQASRQDPALAALAALRATLDRPTPVPTRVLCGAHDMRREMLEGQRGYFTGAYDWGTVDGAGHFLHREQPAVVNRLILEWLKRE